MKLNPALVTISTASTTKAYGQLATVPMWANERAGLVRCILPADIPDNAIVTKADMVFSTAEAYTGSRQFTLQRNSVPGFTVSTATWANKPGVEGSLAQVTVGAVAINTEFRISVLSHVQSMIAGSIPNNGWRFTTDAATAVRVRGAKASIGQPYLDLEYALPGDPPSDLSPDGGAVSVAKPTLTFFTPDDMTALQVQIDSGQDGTAPDFDSGSVPATGGVLELTGSWAHTGSVTKTSGTPNLTGGTFVQADVGASITGTGIPGGTTILSIGGGGTTAVMSANASSSGTITATITRTYPGLSDGSSTSWRVRVESASGWSGWSDWATFSRVNKTTVTITSPASTSGDPTPPITWTAAGQVSWRAFLFDAVTGKELADSGLTTSADLAWTPPKGLAKVGDQGRAEVRVWDAVERVATPGDPVFAVDTQDFTLVSSSVASGVTTLTATNTSPDFSVVLNWTGAAADNWQIVRDNVWVERIDGLLTTYTDRGARPGVQHTYKVLRVSGGAVSPNGPSATVTPNPPGVWLYDPETNQKVFIVNETVDLAMTDQAVIHAVIDAPPVRRRAGQPPASGTVSGNFVDGSAGLAATFDAIAMGDFKPAPQSNVFRLIWADRNIPVQIGDLESLPIREGNTVFYAVTFSWWHDGSERWED